MIQLQALNYIINKNDLDFLSMYDEKYYFNYVSEYKFICNHAKSFKKAPDISTMLDNFPEFTPIDVTESVAYIQARLYEEYVYNTTVNIINSNSDAFSQDAVKAKDAILAKLQAITPPNRSYGVDIIKDAQKRYDVLVERQANPELHIFSTGLDQLDMLLGGGLRRSEELVVIYARTNNAKTWIAEKLAVEVWKQNHNIGFFSPEMSPLEIGYRFDTLFKNFDNHGITGSIKDFDSEPYKKYTKTLSSKNRAAFSVTTPLDFPDKRVTVSELKRWIDDKKLDMLVIDGLAYLTNERSNGRKNTTENLTEISEDLMTLSLEMTVPIVVVMQANRVGARDSDGEVSTESPELDTIRGSDGISHNASRALSIYKAKDIIKIYISKNRYGEKGQHLYYQYDINTGKFTYVPNPKDGMAIDTTDTDSSDNSSSNSLFKDSTEVF